MNLQLVIPVTRKLFSRTAGVVVLALASVGLMYLIVGLIGALVLTAELLILGRLLYRAARGD